MGLLKKSFLFGIYDNRRIKGVRFDDDYIRYYYNKDYQVLLETDDEDAELRTFVYGRGLDEVLVNKKGIRH